MGNWNTVKNLIGKLPVKAIVRGGASVLADRLAIKQDALPGIDLKELESKIRAGLNVNLGWDQNTGKYSMDGRGWERAVAIRYPETYIFNEGSQLINNVGWTIVAYNQPRRAFFYGGVQTNGNILIAFGTNPATTFVFTNYAGIYQTNALTGGVYTGPIWVQSVAANETFCWMEGHYR